MNIYRRNFAPGKLGILFSESASNGAILRYFHVGNHSIATLARFDSQTAGLALSPDEHSLLFTQQATAGMEIMVVDNFR